MPPTSPRAAWGLPPRAPGGPHPALVHVGVGPCHPPPTVYYAAFPFYPAHGPMRLVSGIDAASFGIFPEGKPHAAAPLPSGFVPVCAAEPMGAGGGAVGGPAKPRPRPRASGQGQGPRGGRGGARPPPLNPAPSQLNSPMGGGGQGAGAGAEGPGGTPSGQRSVSGSNRPRAKNAGAGAGAEQGPPCAGPRRKEGKHYVPGLKIIQIPNGRQLPDPVPPQPPPPPHAGGQLWPNNAAALMFMNVAHPSPLGTHNLLPGYNSAPHPLFDLCSSPMHGLASYLASPGGPNLGPKLEDSPLPPLGMGIGSAPTPGGEVQGVMSPSLLGGVDGLVCWDVGGGDASRQGVTGGLPGPSHFSHSQLLGSQGLPGVGHGACMETAQSLGLGSMGGMGVLGGIKLGNSISRLASAPAALAHPTPRGGVPGVPGLFILPAGHLHPVAPPPGSADGLLSPGPPTARRGRQRKGTPWPVINVSLPDSISGAVMHGRSAARGVCGGDPRNVRDIRTAQAQCCMVMWGQCRVWV